MKKFTALLIIYLLPVILAIHVMPVNGQESAYVSAIIQEAGEDLGRLDEIISEHETLLQKYPKGPFASTIMFQLAELYAQRSQISYQQAMEAYEKNIERYDRGEISVEPVLPQMDMTKTITYCNRLLDEFPGSKFTDKILYKLGISYMQEGNKLRSKDYFESIVSNYPDSPIAVEAHFRIGEFYFSQREYQTAITHYNHLLDKWDNPYFDMSLYKLGWSYYNLSNYTKAISSFLYLIEDISLLERANTQVLNKTKADLRSEAILYIASCFTEYGGPEAAKDFFEQHKTKDYTLPVLLKIYELYYQRNYYAEAIEILNAVFDIYPYYQNAPDIYAKIIDCYELKDDIAGANSTREKLVQYVGPGSDWLSNQSDSSKAKGLEITKSSLVYLGTFYQSEAQQGQSESDYRMAIDKYIEYLEKFPTADDAVKINYYLADCYFEINEFDNAATAYYDVVLRDSLSKSEFKEQAAFNRILSYYQLFSDSTKAGGPVDIANFLSTDDTLTFITDTYGKRNLLISCNDFVLRFPKSQVLDQVYMKYGEVMHNLKYYLQSIEIYKKVIEMGDNRPYRLLAAMNAGQCYYDAELYHESEIWFSSIIKAFPDSTRFLQKAEVMASSSNFKIAEALNQEGRPLEAADLLTSIAATSTNSEFQERALFESASQYQLAEEPLKAAQALEQLFKRFPQSELADKALYKAAGLRESIQNWDQAVNDYILLVDNIPQSTYSQTALRNAAYCYENQEDWYSARNMYERFVKTFPDAGDELLEALFKIGDMNYKVKDFTAAEDYFNQTIDRYNTLLNTGDFVDNYFAAQAQFMIGEIYFAPYKNIELVPPLKTNLQLKVNNLQKVLTAYKNALEYQVADWSTAATYKIGMSFEEFYRAFVESPPPDELDQEQLETYVNMLHEKAEPYKTQALETYKRNVEQAEANSIANSWVTASQKRINYLTTGSEELQKAQADDNSEEINVAQETAG